MNDLNSYIENHGIMKTKFAIKLGINYNYLRYILAGQRKPSVKLAKEIERLSGIPWEKWFNDQQICPCCGQKIMRNETETKK